MSAGVLAILGSGETAPGMTKIHRQLLKPIADLRAVNIDTSYGFQLNVTQMSAKLEEYFATSLRVSMDTLHFPSFEQASEVERALFKRRVRGSNFIFAGPGSPTYALGQWFPLDFENDLLAVLGLGGTLCFSSAASLTLGAFTAPIYEIYKVGDQNPTWRTGLDVLGHFGLACAVIPHFDNAEGRNYDTRYCYLGEPRLRALESLLPSGVATLGVDEHTAIIFDFDRDEARVEGRSHAHWRSGSETRILNNGEVTPLESLRNASIATTPQPPTGVPVSPSTPVRLANLASLGGEVGVEALAELVELASRASDERVDGSALIEEILRARLHAREQRDFAVSDLLRDILVSVGVEIRDSSSGADGSVISAAN